MNKVSYSEVIGKVKERVQKREELETKLVELNTQWDQLMAHSVELNEATNLLTVVANKTVNDVLTFITGVINKTLSEMFKSDVRKIAMRHKVYSGNRGHIVVELTNGKGDILDMNLQTGTGLKQVVSGLFTICLIEVRKARRLVIFDEKFSGLHSEAKAILTEILKIFAEGGFQFIFVEYSLNNLGKIYNVEKPDDVAMVYDLDGKEYKDTDVFLFSKNVDTSILDEDFVEYPQEEEAIAEFTIGE